MSQSQLCQFKHLNVIFIESLSLILFKKVTAKLLTIIRVLAREIQGCDRLFTSNVSIIR